MSASVYDSKKMRPNAVLVALLALSSCLCCGRGSRFYMDRGDKLLAKGKLADAYIAYRKAIQRDSRCGEAYYDAGNLEVRLGKKREAYNDLSRAAQLLPDREDVSVAFADFILLSYSPKNSGAVKIYNRAAAVVSEIEARFPNSYNCLRLKAQLAAIDGKLPEAEGFYRRADAVSRLQPPVVLGWTEVLLRENKPDDAKALAARFMASEPAYKPLYEVLYRYDLQTNNLGDAEIVLKSRAANIPKDDSCVIELAAFYFSVGREHEAQAALRGVLNRAAVSADSYLRVGDMYRALRRWDDAIEQYQAGIRRLGPRTDFKARSVFLKKIVDVRVSQGRGDLAEPILDEILKAKPGESDAEIVRAALLISRENPVSVSKGVEALRRLVEREPRNAVLRFQLGRGLVAQGLLDAARAQFQAAANANSSYLDPRLALADLSRTNGDYAATLNYAREILAVNPDLLQARILRAESLSKTGRTAEGRKELLELEKSFPRDPGIQWQLARMDLRDGRFNAARDRFDRLARRNPDDILPPLGLAQTLDARSRFDEAMTLLSSQLKKSPDNPQLLLVLASTAISSGKYDLALEQYRHLLATGQRSASIYLAMGSAYRLKSDLPNAIDSFKKASAIAPRDPTPLVLLGEALNLSPGNAEAIDVCRRAVALSPENANALNGLAYVLSERGENLDEALNLARRATQKNPGEPHFVDTLAWIHLKQHTDRNGQAVFERLVAEYPESPGFRYHLAMALLENGDKAAARAQLNTALSHSHASDLRGKIEAALSRTG